MDKTFDAAELSPVPAPAHGAQPPELCRGVYGMPMFVTVPCPDLEASAQFWTHGLGFFELFSIPGQLVHLRRWAFQDVLLVPAEADAGKPSSGAAPIVSFACVLDQLDEMARSCRSAGAISDGPHDRPWNAREIAVTAPEGTRIVMTAGKPLVPGSPEAQALDKLGISTSDPASAAREEDTDDRR